MHDHFPMTIGSLLKASIAIYIRNWRPFTAMSLAALPSLGFLLTLVPLLVLGLGFFTLPAVGWYPTWLQVVIIPGMVAIILVVGMLPYILAKATTVMAVSQYYVEGRVTIWSCFKLALRRAVYLTLSSSGVGFVAVLIFFVFGYAISFPLAYAFAVPLNSLFGDDFWFDFGWLIPFWLALLLSVLISWLFFVEGRMFNSEHSDNRARMAGMDSHGRHATAYLPVRILAIGCMYSCGAVAVWSGVILGTVALFVSAVLVVADEAHIPTFYLLFLVLLAPFVATLVVVTPPVWIGRTLAYFDQMQRSHGRQLELIQEDGGAFCWVIRTRPVHTC